MVTLQLGGASADQILRSIRSGATHRLVRVLHRTRAAAGVQQIAQAVRANWPVSTSDRTLVRTLAHVITLIFFAPRLYARCATVAGDFSYCR